MSLYLPHIKSLVEKTLKDFDEKLYSKSAVNLILGTIAQESRFGTYLYQLGGGPAIGIIQMEQETFNWIKNLYLRKYPELLRIHFEDLAWNLKAAIIFCRLRYRPIPARLPDFDDLEGLAKYWKQYYNTISGKGTVQEFINNYKKYVATSTTN